MGKVLMMRKGETHTAPSAGILLSSIAEGSIVKINENGNPIEFYIAQHDYESGLNGAGRTLLVRKDGYVKGKWRESTSYGNYENSVIDNYLNSIYKNVLDSITTSLIATTTFLYNDANSYAGIKLSRAIFTLSLTELGTSASYSPTLGSKLPTSDILKDSNLSQWVRDCHTQNGTYTYLVVGSSGDQVGQHYEGAYYRPCFTLPSTAKFDKDTLVLKG